MAALINQLIDLVERINQMSDVIQVKQVLESNDPEDAEMRSLLLFEASSRGLMERQITSMSMDELNKSISDLTEQFQDAMKAINIVWNKTTSHTDLTSDNILTTLSIVLPDNMKELDDVAKHIDMLDKGLSKELRRGWLGMGLGNLSAAAQYKQSGGFEKEYEEAKQNVADLFREAESAIELAEKENEFNFAIIAIEKAEKANLAAKNLEALARPLSVGNQLKVLSQQSLRELSLQQQDKKVDSVDAKSDEHKGMDSTLDGDDTSANKSINLAKATFEQAKKRQRNASELLNKNVVSQKSVLDQKEEKPSDKQPNIKKWVEVYRLIGHKGYDKESTMFLSAINAKCEAYQMMLQKFISKNKGTVAASRAEYNMIMLQKIRKCLFSSDSTMKKMEEVQKLLNERSLYLNNHPNVSWGKIWFYETTKKQTVQEEKLFDEMSHEIKALQKAKSVSPSGKGMFSGSGSPVDDKQAKPTSKQKDTKPSQKF